MEGSVKKLEDKLEEIMQRGGFGFWVLCGIFTAGFYAFLWLTMSLGVAAGY
jgi:hypothetical protein